MIVEGLEGGFYLGPAIIQGVNPNMQIYKEEVFGPVMMLIPFETFEVNVHFVVVAFLDRFERAFKT